MPSCAQCKTQFLITTLDRQFYDRIAPVFDGKKFALPDPKLCPDCRQQNRLLYKNERVFYPRRCGMCSRKIISIYSPDKPYKIFCPDCYWSDRWDAREYGQDFDFKRSFAEQFDELNKDVPQLSLTTLKNESSEFTHDTMELKHCFLVFDGENGRDCMYGETFINLNDSMDFYYLFDSELCYECVSCRNMYDCKFCFASYGCSECWFLRDCQSCENCFGCANLMRKKYHIFNEPVSKAEYEHFIGEFKSRQWTELEKMKLKTKAFWLSKPVRFAHGLKNENVIGDFVDFSKNAMNCFDCSQIQDCKYCYKLAEGARDCFDLNVWGDNTELILNCDGVGGNAQNILFSYYIGFNASNILYATQCYTTHFLFGCSNMRHSDHCIFNKKYSKEEYEKLVPQIINSMIKTNEWGEFLSPKISPFGYNETHAREYFPLAKNQALALGFNWSDYEAPPPKTDKIIKADQLNTLDNIEQVSDDILNLAIECAETKKLFRIQKAELNFYRQHKLPIPHFHPDTRHAHRMAIRNLRHLYHRACDCEGCEAEFETTYTPDYLGKIYCESCYQKGLV
ncbi:MAG: hypothetical protein NTZ80_01365 [Patescibacteria group bacterium]|nr:hypothetical protein [Patescibacteria group bacterium]